ncbi:MAG: hypothetical protein WBJ13_09020 [Sedimentibacter sp.]
MEGFILIAVLVGIVIYVKYTGAYNGTEYQVSSDRKFEKVKAEAKNDIKSNFSPEIIYAGLDRADLYTINENNEYENILLANPVYIILFNDLIYIKSFYELKELGQYKSENQIFSIRKITLELKDISELKYYKNENKAYQIFIKKLIGDRFLLTFPIQTDYQSFRLLIKFLEGKGITISKIIEEEIKEYKALEYNKFTQIEPTMYTPEAEDYIKINIL